MSASMVVEGLAAFCASAFLAAL